MFYKYVPKTYADRAIIKYLGDAASLPASPHRKSCSIFAAFPDKLVS